MILEQNKKNC